MFRIIGAMLLGAALAVGTMLAIGFDRTLAASFEYNARTVSHIIDTGHTVTGGE